MKSLIKNSNLSNYFIIIFMLIILVSNVSAQINLENLGVSIYGNFASPTNDFFKDEYKNGFGVGLEIIKNFVEESPVSGFALLQFSSFPVLEEDDFFSNEPLQVFGVGAGLRATKVVENFRFFADGGLLLSKSNHYHEFTHYVNGTLTEEKQLASESVFFGGVFSLGFGVSILDIKAKYFTCGKNVSYFALCFGISYFFE